MAITRIPSPYRTTAVGILFSGKQHNVYLSTSIPGRVLPQNINLAFWLIVPIAFSMSKCLNGGLDSI